MIKRLAAFDFDGTLMNSPEKEFGKIGWQKKTGREYPYEGWWGRPESLDLNVFDINPFPSVLHQLKKEQSTPNTFVIVLTSRMEKLRPQVQAVLDANDIHVDKLDMKYNWKNKGEKILDYINEFPELEEINVYDDMEKHIQAFEEIKNQIPEHITFNIYKADNGKLALTEGLKIKRIIQEELENFVDEITHDDIKVIKGWNGETGIEINGEYQNGRIIDKSELPDELYHVSPYKNEVLADGYLKSQKMGGGFGGGRIEGISVSADIENAKTYYFGIILAILLSKTKTKDDLIKTLDWWIEKQRMRIGGNLNKLKKFFFDEFNRRQKILKEPFMDSVEMARRNLHILGSKINPKLDDPLIIGGIEKFKSIDINNVVIFIVKKENISDDIPIITGTDKGEIRILGDVPVKDFFKP